MQILRLLWQGESAQLAADLGDGLFATEPDGFLDFFARELAEPLRKLTRRGPAVLTVQPRRIGKTFPSGRPFPAERIVVGVKARSVP